jgi:hypothetical protein
MSRSGVLPVLTTTVELEDTLELEIEGNTWSSRPLSQPGPAHRNTPSWPCLPAARAVLKLGCRAHPSTGHWSFHNPVGLRSNGVQTKGEAYVGSMEVTCGEDPGRPHRVAH